MNVNAEARTVVVHYGAAMKVLFISLLFFGSVAFAADKLEDTLNHQYRNQTYTLRQPMTAPTQQYDSLGNSPTASALGPWTVYGRVQIKKIKVQPNRLVIQGQRIGMKFSEHHKTLVPAKLDHKVELEISLSQPLDSADQVHTIFSHVFAFSQEDFLASVPVLWQAYLSDHLESYADDGRQIVFKPYVPSTHPQKKPETGANDLYQVGKGVTAPKAKFTPDPSYTPAAREVRLDTVMTLYAIVDKAGTVRNTRVVKPAGLGLDEQADYTVRTWKFEPATRNGEPVNVELLVEVSFHIW